MGGIDYRPGHEKGIWYELVCIRQTIAGKEAKGKDASFERGLYKAWLKDSEYSKVDKENQTNDIYGVLAQVVEPQEPVTKANPKELYQRQNVTAPETPPTPAVTLAAPPDNVTKRCRDLSTQGASTREIAEILKAEGIFISHMTVARKLQGVLV